LESTHGGTSHSAARARVIDGIIWKVVAKNVSVWRPFVTAIEQMVKVGFSCDDRGGTCGELLS
jgi:hypothetical protein